MGDGSENWQWVVRRLAQAAGVPVLQPCDSRELVARLDALLRGPGADAAETPARDGVAQPAQIVLGRILESATGRTPALRTDAPLVAVPSNVPTRARRRRGRTRSTKLTASQTLAAEMCS
jgi:hypothetical protein